MKNILKYDSYDIISSLVDQLSHIFPYVKVVNNRIYSSTIIDRSGSPIVRIDSKRSVKGLLLEVGECRVIIKSIVNSSVNRNLIAELIRVFRILPRNFEIVIEQDVNSEFWNKVIESYPTLNWVKL